MSEAQRDWYTSDYPELRDGPPWVMEEMILAQPNLVEAILREGQPAAAALRAAVADAGSAGSPP